MRSLTFWFQYAFLVALFVVVAPVVSWSHFFFESTMMKFYPAVFASVLFATASAQTCKDLKLGEEAIIPGEEYVHERNAKLMTD